MAGLGRSSISLSRPYLTPAMASPHWPLAFRFLYLKSRARAPGADYSQHSCDREGRQPRQCLPPVLSLMSEWLKLNSQAPTCPGHSHSIHLDARFLRDKSKSACRPPGSWLGPSKSDQSQTSAASVNKGPGLSLTRDTAKAKSPPARTQTRAKGYNQ